MGADQLPDAAGLRQKESWAANPERDGCLRHFKNARVVPVEGAGHWVHHDRLQVFLDLLRDFL